MTNEERYKEALLHVIRFIDGDNEFDRYKPLNAKLANDISEMCRLVLSGKTTAEAIQIINN